MPRIELITPVYYGPSDPYHWEIDNLPLKSIIRRQELINLALDDVIELMRDAIGTQGSVANRLNQSINPDGSLKTAAVDETLHSIEEHTDTDNYVRMTAEQSDKLDLIADEANQLNVEIFTDDTTFTEFSDGTLKFKPSDTIEVTVDAPNIVKFHMAFPAAAAHQHFYGLTPEHVNIVTPDYINYQVDSVSTVFVEDTLRVYINGVRIFSDVEVYVPGALVDDAWTLMKFTPDFENGTFALSSAITEDDVIRIDFDISFV